MFNERLKELRISKNLTQKQVADAIGKSDRGYRKYELGENEPTLSILILIADFFNVSIDYLTCRTDDKTFTPRKTD